MPISKKGLEGPTWILVVIIILLMFLFVYSAVSLDLFGKEIKIVKKPLEDIEKGADKDKDGVIDLLDRCPGVDDAIGC